MLYSKPILIKQNEKVVAPYGVKDLSWLGFDDEESIRIKSEYIKQEGFAGGMVWSIDTDDFHGFCTGTKFGLTSKIAEVIILEESFIGTKTFCFMFDINDFLDLSGTKWRRANGPS